MGKIILILSLFLFLAGCGQFGSSTCYWQEERRKSMLYCNNNGYLQVKQVVYKQRHRDHRHYKHNNHHRPRHKHRNHHRHRRHR